MSWALLSGILSIAGSLLLAYPALRAARAIAMTLGQSDASDESDGIIEILETELRGVSVAWAGKLYWMLVSGFIALVLSGITAVLDAKACPTPW